MRRDLMFPVWTRSPLVSAQFEARYLRARTANFPKARFAFMPRFRFANQTRTPRAPSSLPRSPSFADGLPIQVLILFLFLLPFPTLSLRICYFFSVMRRRDQVNMKELAVGERKANRCRRFAATELGVWVRDCGFALNSVLYTSSSL